MSLGDKLFQRAKGAEIWKDCLAFIEKQCWLAASNGQMQTHVTQKALEFFVFDTFDELLKAIQKHFKQEKIEVLKVDDLITFDWDIPKKPFEEQIMNGVKEALRFRGYSARIVADDDEVMSGETYTTPSFKLQDHYVYIGTTKKTMKLHQEIDFPTIISYLTSKIAKKSKNLAISWHISSWSQTATYVEITICPLNASSKSEQSTDQG